MVSGRVKEQARVGDQQLPKAPLNPGQVTLGKW